MESIAQALGTSSELARNPLSETFVQSLRQISADRAAEVEALLAERDSYRELAQAAMRELAVLNTRLDRERSSRLFMLAQYRALRDDTATADPIDRDEPMPMDDQAAA